MFNLHLLITRDDLVPLATRAKSVVADKPSSPVLGCVVIDASGEGLSATAMDPALTYVGRYPCNVQAPGRVAVDAANLLTAAKNMPPGVVTLTHDSVKQRLTLTGNKAKTVLPTFDPADFPMPNEVEGRAFVVEAADVRRMLGTVEKSMAPEGDKYGFDGVKVHSLVGGVIRFVASSGSRVLSYDEAPFTGVDPGPKLMLPRKGATALLSMLGNVEGPVTFTLAPTSTVVSVGGATLHIRKMEDQFPDYPQVIPKDKTRTLTFGRDAALAAVKCVGDFSGSGLARIDVSADGVVVSATYADKGNAEAGFPAELTGEPFAFGCSVVSTKESLTSIGCERVVLAFKDEVSPVLLTNPDDGRVLFILMPCRA